MTDSFYQDTIFIIVVNQRIENMFSKIYTGIKLYNSKIIHGQLSQMEENCIQALHVMHTADFQSLHKVPECSVITQSA